MKKKILAISVVCCMALGLGLITRATETRTFTPGDYYTPSKNDYYVTKEEVKTVPNTVEAWFCLDGEINADTRGGVLVGNYDGTADITYSVEVFSEMHPRVLMIDANGNAQSYVFSKVTLPAGEFVHLSIVRDMEANNILCYVGGELQQTLKLYGDQITNLNSHLGVGGDYKEGNNTCFNGEINNIALFSDVRTAEEIQTDMRVGADDAEGLVANWSFDVFEAGQATVADASGQHALVRSAEWMEEFNVGDYDYTIALVGDTQWLNYYHGDNYIKLYEYLVQNSSELKIKAVLGLGDITEKTTDEEWERADDVGTYLAENNMPYSMIVGNHDLFSGSRQQFDATFTISEFESQGFFKGSFEDNSVSNAYYEIKLGNTDYLIFGLEYGPRDEVLEWAGQIIADNPNKNVIITTHAYMLPDGTYIYSGNSGASCSSPSEAYGYNDADEVWNQLASKYSNISMVICGHVDGTFVAQQTVGEQGNVVTEMTVDATSLDSNDTTQAGAGMVCLLHIKESADGNHEVLPVMYSTIQGQYHWPSYQDSFTMYGTDVAE